MVSGAGLPVALAGFEFLTLPRAGWDYRLETPHPDATEDSLGNAIDHMGHFNCSTEAEPTTQKMGSFSSSARKRTKLG